jgi:putative hydrolase of the HAD superfamily
VSLGIVSNTGRTPGVILRRGHAGHGLLGYFGVISDSDEIGVRKPVAQILRVTLARAGVAADEAVHIGDNPEADVAGAHGVGIRAAHYTAGFRRPSAEAEMVIADLASLADEVFRIAPGKADG